MENLTVRDLLVESKISENLQTEVDRLNYLKESLKEFTENYKTMVGIMEGNEFLKESESGLKEAVRLFKVARKSLSEAKEGTDLATVNENVRVAHKCLNDIENLIEYEVSGYMHEALDVLEEAEKRSLNESVEYEDVFFAQEHEADDILEIIQNKGEAAAIDYLKQWHYPGEHATRSEPGHGSDDETFEKDGYILSYNPRIGYVGLVYRQED